MLTVRLMTQWTNQLVTLMTDGGLDYYLSLQLVLMAAPRVLLAPLLDSPSLARLGGCVAMERPWV